MFKGTRNNKGRPKGSVNRATAKVREVYAQLLEENLDQLKEDFKKLEPKERIRLMLDMSKYVIPTLKATEYIVPKPETPHYTTEEREKRIKELLIKSTIVKENVP